MAASLERARRDVLDLGRANLELNELGRWLSDAVQPIAAHEGYCLIGFDPVSGRRAFHTARNALPDSARRLAHNEAVERDLNRFDELARRRVPVGTLGGGGAEERCSVRLHDILPEHGFARELRLVLHRHGRLWGALVLLREHKAPAFSDDAASNVATLAAPITESIRQVSQRRRLRPSGAHPPAGVILADAGDTVTEVSPEAADWLADLPVDDAALAVGDPLPRTMIEAAATARRTATPREPVTRIRTHSGHWLSLHACPLHAGRVTLVLAAATPAQLLPAVAAWAGLTDREAQIAGHLLDGQSRKQIARELNLSINTVTGYLDVIYRKTESHGHDDLLAQLH